MVGRFSPILSAMEVILLFCNPWPTRPPAADVVAHMLQDVQPHLRAKRCYVPEPGKGTHADLEYRCVVKHGSMLSQVDHRSFPSVTDADGTKHELCDVRVEE